MGSEIAMTIADFLALVSVAFAVASIVWALEMV
jgi:hypothetical protein